MCSAVDRFRALRTQSRYPQLAPLARTGFPSPFEHLLKHQVIAVEAGVLLAQAGDGAAGVQHGGVIAVAEGLADLWQAHLREVLGKRHRHLTRPGHIAAALL